jgi:hypothetical protein
MPDGRESHLHRFAVGAGQSAAAATALLLLLHRVMAHTAAHPDVLFLGAVRDFARLEWTWPYLIAVLLGCAVAIARRDAAAMVRVQWYSLGGGLFLTMYGLGAEVGEKVDPRLIFVVWGGIAALYSCYACFIGHVVIALGTRTRRSAAGR